MKDWIKHLFAHDWEMLEPYITLGDEVDGICRCGYCGTYAYVWAGIGYVEASSFDDAKRILHELERSRHTFRLN